MRLNFNTQTQVLDNWCWAAVSSSVAFYYNGSSNWSQSAIAAKLISGSCSGINAGNAPVAPPVCNAIMDIGNALKLVGNFSGDLLRPLTFNEIVIEINNGRPVCCQIVWEGFSQSHFVSVYGYEGTNVIVGDPQAGIFSVSYNNFVSGYRGGAWKRSIGTRSLSVNTI